MKENKVQAFPSTSQEGEGELESDFILFCAISESYLTAAFLLSLKISSVKVWYRMLFSGFYYFFYLLFLSQCRTLCSHEKWGHAFSHFRTGIFEIGYNFCWFIWICFCYLHSLKAFSWQRQDVFFLFFFPFLFFSRDLSKTTPRGKPLSYLCGSQVFYGAWLFWTASPPW